MKTAQQITVNLCQPRDYGVIVAWTTESYWGGWLTAEQITASLKNSLTFVAWIDGRPVGFIRIVTDYAVFSAITDCYVDPRFRLSGVGTALMDAVLPHPVGKTIIILTSRDAKDFYARFNFVPLGGDVMKRDPSR